METVSTHTPEQIRVGGPARLVLLAEPPLLAMMREAAEGLPGVQLVGAFGSSNELVDWLMWKRADWQVAFVDFALRRGSPAEAVGNLLSQPLPGEVVALGDSHWPEMRQACAAMGIQRILDRGNILGFRGFLHEWLQHA